MRRCSWWAVLGLVLVAFAAGGVASGQRRKAGAAARKARPAPERARFADGQSATVPLEVDNNIIFLHVSVNNSRPLKFLFDTGASVSLIKQSVGDGLGLKPKGRARGDATGGAIEVSLIEGVTLGAGGAVVSDQLLASMPFEAPVEFDGIIGYDFIKEFVVELDYRARVMRLHNPRTYQYGGRGTVVPLLLAGRKTPLVRATLVLAGRGPVSADLEVDTGADGTFLINSPLVRRENLARALTDLVLSGGIGAGGEQQRVLGRARAVHFAGIRIDNPPVGLSLDTEGSGASAEADGLIGGEILRRFRVVLDYSRRRMILEPNESFKEPFELETGGS
jgi:hypothetical protein